MTSRRLLPLVIAPIVLGLGLGSCPPGAVRSDTAPPPGALEDATRRPAAPVLGFLLSGSTAGEVEPCG